MHALFGYAWNTTFRSRRFINGEDIVLLVLGAAIEAGVIHPFGIDRESLRRRTD